MDSFPPLTADDIAMILAREGDGEIVFRNLGEFGEIRWDTFADILTDTRQSTVLAENLHRFKNGSLGLHVADELIQNGHGIEVFGNLEVFSEKENLAGLLLRSGRMRLLAEQLPHLGKGTLSGTVASALVAAGYGGMVLQYQNVFSADPEELKAVTADPNAARDMWGRTG